jgi:hypothetical protein
LPLKPRKFLTTGTIFLFLVIPPNVSSFPGHPPGRGFVEHGQEIKNKATPPAPPQDRPEYFSDTL